MYFRDFQENYEIITSRGEPYSPRTIISLFEGRPGSCGTPEQQPPSLVERIVEEQMRLMAEGEKSKEDAMAAAIDQVSAENTSIIIQAKAS